ncbi:2-amino-4-hydroxy-6-hydroxymethyldihydropteridine diphosphokinase [Belliella marina]|uniref:2-amino-4-hydroxy-6-hydroxymethyldihydropteridine pyrophosphokinase n=1 Tax=Belliella marina TaxID=1644146 RepID=A0ABW4VFB2_9BACT
MKQVILIIGGNRGDRKALISEAKSMLEQSLGKVKVASSIYETQAWGEQSEGDYLNQVLSFDTSLEADQVLDIALGIEDKLGREREIKWGNRTMDIDILYYADEIIEKAQLKVPHPYLSKRRFVLVPLVEVIPDFVHPQFHVTNRELLEKCGDDSKVLRFE